METEAKLIYKPKYHVCSTYLWNYERRRSEVNFITGMILQCTCGKYYELRIRSSLFGNWTISWNQSRLFWVEIKKSNVPPLGISNDTKPKVSNNTAPKDYDG